MTTTLYVSDFESLCLDLNYENLDLSIYLLIN